MKQFNRYVWLVDLIHRAGRITFEAINERWMHSQLNEGGEELPLRTFHNHLTAIQQMFDINVECDRRAGYVYYIENGLELGGVHEWLLGAFALGNLLNESRSLGDRILFENIPSGQRFLMPIVEAMRDGMVMEVDYEPFWGDGFTMTLYPYFVKVFHQRWYVVGYNPYNDDVRIYSLDRISGLRATEERFEMPAGFSAEDFFTDSYGVSLDGGAPERVVLKATERQAKYLRALPLHHSQREVSQGVFEYFLRPHSYDLKQALLSQMTEIELLEPASLRAELCDILHDMVEKYK